MNNVTYNFKYSVDFVGTFDKTYGRRQKNASGCIHSSYYFRLT